MTTSDEAYLDMRLAACERWWRETANPLYVWEAIALSLNSSQPLPIPDWCVPYLGEAARKLTDLNWAVMRGKADPVIASKKVSEKLDFVRQGKKNAFLAARDEADALRVALDLEYNGGNATKLIARQTGRNLSPERVRAIVRRGKKLLRG